MDTLLHPRRQTFVDTLLHPRRRTFVDTPLCHDQAHYLYHAVYYLAVTFVFLCFSILLLWAVGALLHNMIQSCDMYSCTDMIQFL